ncbi:MAG: oligosaccharide flippase family protein [Pseudomonadota bacterium]
MRDGHRQTASADTTTASTATRRRRTADSLERGSMVGLLAEVLVLPTGLLTAAVLTRALGIEEYGFIGLVIAASMPIAWLVTGILGFRAGVRLIADAPDPVAAASGILRANLVIGGVAAVIFALSAPMIARVLGHPEVALALVLASAEIVLLPVSRVHRDALTATRRFSHAALAGGVFHVARLVGIVALVLSGLGVEAVICALSLARCAEILWCRTRLPIPLTRSSGLSMVRLFGFAWPLFLNEFSNRVINASQMLMLGVLGAGTTALSHFSASQVVGHMPALMIGVIVPGVVAEIAAGRSRQDPAAIAEASGFAWRFVGVIAAGLLVVAGGAEALMSVLFGAAFAPGGAVLSFVLVGGVGALCFGVTAGFLVAVDRPKGPLMISGPAMLLTLMLLPTAIETLGVVGSAAVGCAARTAMGIASLIVARRLGFDGVWILVRALLAGVVGGLIADQTGIFGPPVVEILVGGTVSLGLLFLFGVIDRRTRERLITAVVGSRKLPGAAASAPLPTSGGASRD